jgi:hypothetical protein
MKTLQEDIDDLDRMVDTDAKKDAIRSQIRLVAREVAALQADYSSLAEHHSQFRESAEKTIVELDSKLADKKAHDKKLMDDWFREQAQKQAEFRKRHTLNYDA